MIKPIVDFFKNLFVTKTESEPPKEMVPPTLNTEANWPFPTERPQEAVAPVVAAVPEVQKASTTSPDKRKKRKPVKAAAPAGAAAPAPVKLSPGPSKKHNKPKPKTAKK